MKLCTKCSLEKSEEEFPWKNKIKGRRSSYCKKCQNIFSKEHYRRYPSYYKEKARRHTKRYIEERSNFVKNYLLSHPCVDCGETNILVLEFDHVRGKKIKTISEMVTYVASLEKLEAEIQKCEVRCANCHRIKTIKQLNWTRKLV